MKVLSLKGLGNIAELLKKIYAPLSHKHTVDDISDLQEASTTKSGLLSTDDKSKIDNIDPSNYAKLDKNNNYTGNNYYLSYITMDSNGGYTSNAAITIGDGQGLGAIDTNRYAIESFIAQNDIGYLMFNGSKFGTVRNKKFSSFLTEEDLSDEDITQDEINALFTE